MKIRAAPRVDALRVIAHHHDVVMPTGQQINEITLKLVRVLVFVHENELKSFLVMIADVGVFLEQSEPKCEEVIEIHRIRHAFAGGITFLQVGNGRGELGEVIVLPVKQVIRRLARIGRQ